jgi:hypothetical protein
MPGWVITEVTNQGSSPFDILRVTTDLPATLYLATTPSEPTTAPRWKTVRGILIPCGYTIYWPNPTCYLQAEPTDSLTHTFAIESSDTAVLTAIAFAECCPIVPACPATPPIMWPIGGPNEPSMWIQLAANQTQSIANLDCVPIQWDEEIGSEAWPELTYPFIDIVLPFDGLWAWTSNAWWDTNAVGNRQLFVHEPTAEAQPWSYATAVNIASGAPSAVHGYTWQARGDAQHINVHQTSGGTRTLISNQSGRQATCTVQLIAIGTPD